MELVKGSGKENTSIEHVCCGTGSNSLVKGSGKENASIRHGHVCDSLPWTLTRYWIWAYLESHEPPSSHTRDCATHTFLGRIWSSDELTVWRQVIFQDPHAICSSISSSKLQSLISCDSEAVCVRHKRGMSGEAQMFGASLGMKCHVAAAWTPRLLNW